MNTLMLRRDLFWRSFLVLYGAATLGKLAYIYDGGTLFAPPRVDVSRIAFYKRQIRWPCPQCGVVGPFQYFPPFKTSHKYDKSIPMGKSVKVPGRWTCKWCGYYWSEKFGERQCVPDHKRHVWMFREDASNPNERTPEVIARECGLVMVGIDENGNPLLGPAT